jgi:hypothetical protein
MYAHATGIWHLLYDWQTLVAGLMALVAALIAGMLTYVAGSRQVAEIRRQNRFLRRNEARQLARSVLSSARIIDGILRITEDSIRERRFGGSLTANIEMNATNQIRQSVAVPPQYEVIDYLKNLGREIIDNYFLLGGKITEFRKQSGSATAESLQNEMAALLKVVEHIRGEIADETKKALAVLSDGDPEEAERPAA